MRQDLRVFLKDLEEKYPGDVLRVKENLSINHEAAAVVFELDRQKKYPVVYFENIEGNPIPVVCNISASRQRLAHAFGVKESELASKYAEQKKLFFDPVYKDNPPFLHKVYEGDNLDLNSLPIFRHTPVDAGLYVTGGMAVALDPETGADTCGYHRMQLKGKNKMGISLHSRKRLWEYMRRSEAKNENLKTAIVFGIHPLITLGTGAIVPYGQGKYSQIGGLMGEPLEVGTCPNSKIPIPYWSEIVVLGEILANTHEKEGPFAEFTDFSSYRSTENVFIAHAVYMRENPMFQSIIGGMSSEHTTILGVPREGDLLRFLREKLPMVQGVHVPYSSCGFFHCYISMKKTAEGQPLQAILQALAMDHNFKLVIVVDDDVDVNDESRVLWAVATRVQADRDVVILPQRISMGCTLDPSSDELSRSSKMGIDATQPLGDFSPRIPQDDAARERMRELLKKYGYFSG